MNARAILTRPITSIYDCNLAAAWRGCARNVHEHLFFIRQHRRTIDERDDILPSGRPVHSPSYVASARTMLAHRIKLYLSDIRRVSEYEAKMDLIGMEYARSSDDWREDAGLVAAAYGRAA